MSGKIGSRASEFDRTNADIRHAEGAAPAFERQRPPAPMPPVAVGVVPPGRPAHRPPANTPALVAARRQNQMLEAWRNWAHNPGGAQQSRLEALRRLEQVLRQGKRMLDLSGLTLADHPPLAADMVTIEDAVEGPQHAPASGGTPLPSPTHPVPDRGSDAYPPFHRAEARLDPQAGRFRHPVSFADRMPSPPPRFNQAEARLDPRAGNTYPPPYEPEARGFSTAPRPGERRGFAPGSAEDADADADSDTTSAADIEIEIDIDMMSETDAAMAADTATDSDTDWDDDDGLV